MTIFRRPSRCGAALWLLMLGCLAGCSSDSPDDRLNLPANDSGNVAVPVGSAEDPNASIPPASDLDIAATLLDRSDYSTLLRLIEQLGLTELLQTDNSGLGWTLFAPSDEAFNQLAQLQAMDQDALDELIGLHLYPATVTTENLPDGLLIMTKGQINVVRDDNGITVGQARIVGRDRLVSNGVIHYVDAVLTPAELE